MTRSELSIRTVMTLAPHSIGDEQTLATAKARMQQFRIRHLPVLHGGQLVGVVTERDIAVLEAFEDLDPDKITVDDALTEHLVTVAPDARVADVADTMARERVGSVLIVEGGAVVGIFTTVDACRVLADLLRPVVDHSREPGHAE